jgi:pilus assembly protein FimV
VTPLAPAEEPFYRNQNVLLGGGAALLLIGLLALTRFMRKPRPALAGAGMDSSGIPTEADDEELRLRDALQQNPGNTAASLELLRHYYAQGDAAKFEAAAETMHAHLTDPHAPEWDEALAMGAALAPNHPLFSAVAEPEMSDAARVHHDDMAEPHHEEFTYPVHDDAHDDVKTHIGTFDLGVTHAPAEQPAQTHDDSFDFDLPMQSEETPPPAVDVTSHIEPEPIMPHMESPAAAAPRPDDIYVGEDAIGTKLDLAKAYLDMGDPEGAKSMLDEVLAEGNDTQQDEARKLLAEIR